MLQPFAELSSQNAAVHGNEPTCLAYRQQIASKKIPPVLEWSAGEKSYTSCNWRLRSASNSP
jgi:hypothetical protein